MFDITITIGSIFSRSRSRLIDLDSRSLFDLHKARKIKQKILVMSCVNRTENLARDRIFGKTWQDFSGVALRGNSCKKNLVKIEQSLNIHA